VVLRECCEQAIVYFVGRIIGQIQEWAGVGQVVDGDGDGAGSLSRICGRNYESQKNCSG
jgi:hypothetical protein